MYTLKVYTCAISSVFEVTKRGTIINGIRSYFLNTLHLSCFMSLGRSVCCVVCHHLAKVTLPCYSQTTCYKFWNIFNNKQYIRQTDRKKIIFRKGLIKINFRCASIFALLFWSAEKKKSFSVSGTWSTKEIHNCRLFWITMTNYKSVEKLITLRIVTMNLFPFLKWHLFCCIIGLS